MTCYKIASWNIFSLVWYSFPRWKSEVHLHILYVYLPSMSAQANKIKRIGSKIVGECTVIFNGTVSKKGSPRAQDAITIVENLIILTL